MSEEHGSNRIAGEELRGFVERIERLEGDKSNVADDIKLVYAEAKSRGYTAKYIRALVKLRKLTPSEREEHDAMLELYTAAMGMQADVPLFRHVNNMGVDKTSRAAVIEALKLLAPEDGEIVVRAAGGPAMRIWRNDDGVHAEEVIDAPPRPDQQNSQPEARPRPGDNAPNCTPEEAYELGRQARRDDQAIVSNPFAWNDKRRAEWDKGWRHEDGGDGMGPK